MPANDFNLAQRIDHALLQPTLTDRELEEGCLLARRYGVAAVCIKPYGVPLAADVLAGSSVAVCTTIGFPHGSQAASSKVAEARQALFDGARELDVVVNIGKVLTGDWDHVRRELQEVIDEAHRGRSLVKVILEMSYLTTALKEHLAALCVEASADMLKTSTGFGPTGATEDDVRLLRRCAPASVGVKAAGGIRTLDQALRFHEWGADRIGTSATQAILDAWAARS